MDINLEKLIVDVFDPREGEQVYLLNDFPANVTDVGNMNREAFNPQSEDTESFPENIPKLIRDYEKRREMANLWHAALRKLAKTRGFVVHGVITYEPTGAGGKALPVEAKQNGKTINLHKIMKSWGENDIVLGISRYSATGPIFSLVKNCGQRFRSATMPGATMDMSAFGADYKRVAEKARILAHELTAATYASLRFSTGHLAFFDLRGGREAVADDGVCTQPGQTINLPSGEAYQCPYEGLDNSFGKSLTKGELPVMYGDELVVYQVENNRIVRVVGEGPKAKDRAAFLDVDPARRFIAEFGLGCNEAAVLCGRVLQDEKLEGFHWAHGYNDYLGGAIDAGKFLDPKNMVHNDQIYAADAKVMVAEMVLGNAAGKKVIMRDGLYLPEILGEAFRR